MKIYIVEGHTGQWSDSYQWNIKAFLNRSDALALIASYEKFLPYNYPEELKSACLYELWKLGVVYGWKDIWEDEIPYFIISECDMERGDNEDN